MFGAKPFRCFAALSCSLIFATGSVSARQDFSQTQHAQNAARTGFSSLRISLRLQDESAYVGPAKVNVVRSDGTEVRGRRESEGEIVFPDISPGTYSLEPSAPG